MPTPSYNENHAAPLSYVNDAVAASSQADRQWVTDNIASLVRGLYAAGETEAAAIAQLKQWYDFQTEPQSLAQACRALLAKTVTGWKDDTLTVVTLDFKTSSVIRRIDLPAATSISESAIAGCANLEYVRLQSLNAYSIGFFQSCPKIRTLILPAFNVAITRNNGYSQNIRYMEEYWGKSLLGKTNGPSTADTTKLMKLGVNAQLRQNLDLSDWSPSYVASYPDLADEVLDAEAGVTTNAEQIDYSVRTCIAARLLPLQTEGQCSVTFSSLVYGLLSAETLAAFAAKNWSVGHN